MLGNTLIVLYNYDSSKGIGGRRWMKFGEELTKAGHSIHIVCEKSQSNKTEEIDKITYHYYSAPYPKSLDNVPRNLVEKITYKISFLFQKYKTNGIIYDKCSRHEYNIQCLLEKIINEYKISNLICSGAPFSLLNIGAKIKLKIPSINFIADFRDGWMWGHGYGIPNLSEKRINFELTRQAAVFSNADKLTFASLDLVKKIPHLGSLEYKKIKTIVNGASLIPSAVTNTIASNHNNFVTFIHIGSVNVNTEKYWQPFLESIKNERSICVKFYGNSNVLLENYVSDKKINNVVFIDRVSEKEIYTELVHANIFLMFKLKGFENTFPTKFFDYIQFRKPILCFTEKGEVSTEIKNERIGIVIDEKNINSTKEAIKTIINDKFCFNNAYNFEKFSTSNISKSIESLLI